MHRIGTVWLLYLLASAAFAERPLTALLTNGDDYLAPGIQALRAAIIEATHKVYRIAPRKTKAATSPAKGSPTPVTAIRFVSGRQALTASADLTRIESFTIDQGRVNHFGRAESAGSVQGPLLRDPIHQNRSPLDQHWQRIEVNFLI